MSESRLGAALSEQRAMGELALLLADAIFDDQGVPRGDGRLVLVPPGLFGNDLYLQLLRRGLPRTAEPAG